MAALLDRSIRRTARPLSIGPLRAVAEGALGYFILSVPMQAAGGYVQTVLIIASTIWIVLWPALRLRPIEPAAWWLRAALGLARGLVIGVVLGVVGTALTDLLWRVGEGFHPRESQIAAIAVCFVLARIAVILIAALRRKVRQRLRWQLLVSHVLLILLLLTVMTGVSSVAGIELLLYGVHANPSEMAVTIADDLQSPSGSGINTWLAPRLFHDIATGKTQVNGEPALSWLAIRQFIPNRLLLLRLDGTVISGERNRGSEPARSWSAIYGRPQLWAKIRAAVLAGQHPTIHLKSISKLEPNKVQLGAALVRGAAGHIRGMVVAQVPELALSAPQLTRVTVAIFTASTVAVILASGLPILALSFLFSYVLSRNLSRRLESVSRVTTAIAAGDLSQRAPVGTLNEVGQLARNVNRMADNLEETMDELHTARARAVDALRARRELVASISHELRTPLAIIRAHLEGLTARHLHPVGIGGGAGDAGSDPHVPVSAATLQALQSETERLSALVDDLFALSRAETGGLQVQCEPVDVAALVGEIAALMGPLVRQESRLTLSVDAETELPRALADADRLRQIIANLVRNAARHTPEGGIVALTVARGPAEVVVSVADTGEGIAPEHLPHVFDRFYRADEARSRDSGGAGLGLAIVREFVELMGGRVTVESELGEGSRFSVFLPAEA
jgi:signal transduction histidine kinase